MRPLICLQCIPVCCRKTQHPNLIRANGFVQPESLDGSLMLIFEPMSINSLANIIYNKEERLTSPQISEILFDVVVAMQYLHSKSIVHNYINAQSIYCMEAKSVVGDLQYAQDLNVKQMPISSITSQLPWMAPAQAEGAMPDVASDIYRYAS